MLPPNRFQNVIKHGRVHEGEVNELNVGEVGHEFHFDTHLAGEAEILQQDGHGCGREALANTNGKHDLGVDLLSNLFWCHIGDVVGGKGNGPIHDNDIFLGFWECADAIDAGGFVSEGEGRETEGIEERRAAGGEELVHGGDDGGGEDWLVNFPEPLEEVVHPLCAFVFGDKPRLDKFTLNVVAGPSPDASHRIGIVCRANGEQEE